MSDISEAYIKMLFDDLFVFAERYDIKASMTQELNPEDIESCISVNLMPKRSRGEQWSVKFLGPNHIQAIGSALDYIKRLENITPPILQQEPPKE